MTDVMVAEAHADGAYHDARLFDFVFDAIRSRSIILGESEEQAFIIWSRMVLNFGAVVDGLREPMFMYWIITTFRYEHGLSRPMNL